VESGPTWRRLEVAYDGLLMVVLVLLLLFAAALGILGAVVKVALVIVLSVILAVIILTAGTFYYFRYRLRRFVREMDRRHSAYPARGYKRPGDPELPPR
jgi:heme A synthase